MYNIKRGGATWPDGYAPVNELSQLIWQPAWASCCTLALHTFNWFRSTEFTDEEIASAFKFLDLDHNLHIGAAEIRHILICMGELITDEEVGDNTAENMLQAVSRTAHDGVASKGVGFGRCIFPPQLYADGISADVRNAPPMLCSSFSVGLRTPSVVEKPPNPRVFAWEVDGTVRPPLVRAWTHVGRSIPCGNVIREFFFASAFQIPTAAVCRTPRFSLDV